jgi:ankyrin repeat protein
MTLIDQQYRTSPIHFAATRGNLEIVLILLNHGILPNIIDSV